MLRLTSFALVVLLALTGCTSFDDGAPAGPTTQATPSTRALERYVALGDSFTSAPLVPVTDVANGCFRSDGNYPSLLAERLQLRLIDVSCAGASTRDLARRQRTFRSASAPPQLRALDGRTDLVTLGIGGNDLGLFGTLVRTCLRLRDGDPTGSPCAESAVGRRLQAALPRIGENVEHALGDVRRKAPNAEVVLVGYPRIAPATGGCPRRLPLATGDVRFGHRLLRDLDRELGDAALAAGVDYLDLYAASAGHDVCSRKPWVNGRRTAPGIGLAFHPLPAGARATASLLEDLLTGS